MGRQINPVITTTMARAGEVVQTPRGVETSEWHLLKLFCIACIAFFLFMSSFIMLGYRGGDLDWFEAMEQLMSMAKLALITPATMIGGYFVQRMGLKLPAAIRSTAPAFTKEMTVSAANAVIDHIKKNKRRSA